MADKNFNSITFPGLLDKYKVAQVADEYSSSSTYAVGDIVNHLGTTYRCTTAITTAENWTAGHWTPIKIADEVTDLKSAITQDYAKAYIRNKYDPANNQSGVLVGNSVGAKQTINSSTTLSTQKIDIKTASAVTFNHTRIYAITDGNDIVLKSSTYIVADSNPTTIDLSSYTGKGYLWVSCYDADINAVQVEYGSTLHPYTPHEISALCIDGVPLIPIPYTDVTLTDTEKAANAKKTGELINENKYDIVVNHKAIIDNEANNILSNESMNALFTAERRETHVQKTIPLSETSRKKVLVHLHNRDGTDYDSTSTDVFMPNAEKDFGDVRVTDQNGIILAYDVIYSGNVDVVPDNNLPMPTGKIFKNSDGDWITYSPTVGIAKSSDDGKTWKSLTSVGTDSVIVCLVTQDDVVFYSKNGVLYRLPPPYTASIAVLDISDRTSAYFLSTAVLEYDTNILFAGAYQEARNIEVYKSTDNGLTWNICYSDSSGKYQHIHAMYVDRNSQPNAIYAGCDGGGGVLKSTDVGSTWVDLRTLHPDMPQSTDYGVIFANSNYRFLGGETAIVGGCSIIRTADDSTFNGVLDIGNSVYALSELNGTIFGGFIASRASRQSGIIMTEDNGNSWKSIYNIPIYDGTTIGTSDGARYVSNMGNQIIIGMQNGGTKYPSLRLYSDDNSYYAEILVDVPEGTSSIVVSDGYVCGKRKNIYNTETLGLPEIVKFKFNEDADVVKEFVSGKIYNGDYTFVNGCKHISNIYPYITEPSNEKMLDIGSGFDGFIVDNIDFSSVSGLTISFWAEHTSGEMILFSDSSKTTSTKIAVNGNQLQMNGSNVSGDFNYPQTKGVNYFVITVDFANNVVKGYKNSILRSNVSRNSNASAWINAVKALDSILVLPSSGKVQHFEILNGIATADDVARVYNAGIK